MDRAIAFFGPALVVSLAVTRLFTAISLFAVIFVTSSATGVFAGPLPPVVSVDTDSTFLLVNGERVFVIGSYTLPPGITLDSLRAAGFNYAFEGATPAESWETGLWGGVMLRDAMALEPGDPGDELRSIIHEHGPEPGLVVWHAPDEPAWQEEPIPPQDLRRGYDVIQTEDLYAGNPHPVWLNHAIRGTQEHPDSFSLLLPYNDCADIFSMDPYPVPSWVGHSILPNLLAAICI